MGAQLRCEGLVGPRGAARLRGYHTVLFVLFLSLNAVELAPHVMDVSRLPVKEIRLRAPRSRIQPRQRAHGRHVQPQEI
jgi:hypothetical protein